MRAWDPVFTPSVEERAGAGAGRPWMIQKVFSKELPTPAKAVFLQATCMPAPLAQRISPSPQPLRVAGRLETAPTRDPVRPPRLRGQQPTSRRSFPLRKAIATRSFQGPRRCRTCEGGDASLEVGTRLDSPGRLRTRRAKADGK